MTEPTESFSIRKVEERIGPHGLYVEGCVPADGAAMSPSVRPPILFLGGSFDGSWIFRQESEFFARRGWPVYSVNPRGYFLSRYRDVASLTVEDYLEDIRAAREGLGLERVILAGFSMGGLLMLKHAEWHGAEALVLYDSDASKEVAVSAGKNLQPPHVPPVVQFWPSPAVVDEMWGGHTSRRQYREFLELFKQSSVSGACFRLTEYGGLDVDLARVRCPALVIGIRRDEKVQEEYFRRLNASWIVFEGSSHGSILVGPRSYAITQEVARWLENGFKTGEKKIFPQLGFISWDRQVFRMKLNYFSGWDQPQVVIKSEGVRPHMEVRLERAGAGRIEGEHLYEGTFTLSRRGGFFIRAEHGSEDRPPGGGFYRPLAREIYLADGEFFPDRPSATRTGAIYKDMEFYWKELNHRFKIHLMLPRNHSSGGAPYPVCILNDGQNQWKNQGAFGGWHTNVITSQLCRKGRCRDVVLVSVESTGLSRNKYYVTPPTGRSDLYVNFLADVLLPSLRRTFHLADRPDEIGIVGASYGAHCALYAGLKRPDVFGLIGSLSFAAAPGRPLAPWLNRMPRLPFKKIYFDCGTRWASGQKNSRTDNTRVTQGLIRQAASKGMVHGVHLMGFVAPGHCHNEMFWRKRIGKCIAFLFSPL